MVSFQPRRLLLNNEIKVIIGAQMSRLKAKMFWLCNGRGSNVVRCGLDSPSANDPFNVAARPQEAENL